MNGLQEIESAFVAWARTNDDIRAAFVVGSQARTDHPADEWADLDVLMFARNVERYQETRDWIEALAPVWVSVAGRTAGGDPERMVLFEGGFQVDFVFHHSDVLQQVPHMVRSGNVPEIVLRGTRLLVDKEGVLAHLPLPARLPSPPPLDEETFRQALDGFWFTAVYCAKQLRRGELWLFQTRSGGMTQRLLQMVEWHTRAVHGWDTDTWHDGKFIAEWADPDVYKDLCRTFASAMATDGWRAMRVRLDLYHRLAREVAERLGLDYPDELEAQISACTHQLCPETDASFGGEE